MESLLIEQVYRVELVKPREGTWKLIGKNPTADGLVFRNLMGVIAITSIHLIEGKPQWHVSFSHAGKRIPQGWMEALLRQWRVEDWEEDNHVPNGQVRNFWKPVQPTDPLVCPCKATEEPHLENGGYIWRLEGK